MEALGTGRCGAAGTEDEDEVELQVLCVRQNVQIPIASGGFDVRVITDNLAGGGGDRLIVVAAAAGNHVGYLGLLSGDGDGTGEALVGMRMAGDQGVRTNTRGFACVIDL